MTSTAEDRLRGAFLGHVYGDVFGAPVEAFTPSQIAILFGKGGYDKLPTVLPPVEKVVKLRGKTALWFRRPIGMQTDDTQQAMALLNICAHYMGDDAHVIPDEWGNWLVEGMKDSPSRAWRAFGGMFAGAVTKLVEGSPIWLSGSPSAGIGAAMRTGPLGALYASRDGDREEMCEVALLTSLTTHGDLRAGLLAVAVPSAIHALLTQGGNPEWSLGVATGAAYKLAAMWGQDDYLPEWSEIDRNKARDLPDAMRKVFRTAKKNDPGDIMRTILKVAAEYRDGKTAQRGPFDIDSPNHPFALQGGLTGLMVPLMCPELSPEEVLRRIVSVGGDTDTVGAIAGGILGAMYGTDWIEVDRFYDRERVLAYADCIVTGEQCEDIDTYMETERRLTTEEADFANAELKQLEEPPDP